MTTKRRRNSKRRHDARVSRAKRKLLTRLRRSRTSARWSTGALALAYLIHLATEPYNGFDLQGSLLALALGCAVASLLLAPKPAHVGRATAKKPSGPVRPRRRRRA